MTENRNRQISDIVSSQLPEFVRVDHPTLVAFLEAYYEWLQVNDRGGKLLSPLSLGDVIDVDDTMDDFLEQFKKEFLFNFPEQLAVSKSTGSPVDARKLVKNIKAFYRAKGTEKSYEFLFRILYDTGVEFYYPKKDILRASDGKWYEKNSLKLTNTLGNRIFDCVGRIVYQKNGAGQITASAKVTDVSVYQQGLYEVAELVIVGRNGTFAANKSVSFDVEGKTNTEIKAYSVVSSVTVTSAGSGYAVGDVVSFISAGGDSGIEARGVVSLVTASGAIRKIRLENFGINYNVAPTMNINSLGGSGFAGTANIGSLCLSEGYYLNYDGRLSSNKVLQDNHYYQEFSYVLKTEVVVDRYREAVRRLVHPAGTAMFGQILIKRCAKEDLANSSALIRYEVPIIGHYAPYTFKTFDNLQDWFRYYPEGSTDLTSAGYDPDIHDDLIRGGSNPGNPITSGVSLMVSIGITSAYNAVPEDSVPIYSLPIVGIPSVRGAVVGGVQAGNPLGEYGFKNSYPFWIIYEHPNRRILEPTIAQVWSNQIEDPDFAWEWEEHCSVTGGAPPSGWTADFYSDDPVDKKYTFLKYDGTSEFRKITARAFFEMPVGVPYDCRNADLDTLTPPSVAFSYPVNTQIGETDILDSLTVLLSYSNEDNNGFLPLHQRVDTMRLEFDGSPSVPLSSLDFGMTSVRVDGVLPGVHELRLVPLNVAGNQTDVFTPIRTRFTVPARTPTTTPTTGDV